jgi:hypothetical protein
MFEIMLNPLLARDDACGALPFAMLSPLSHFLWVGPVVGGLIIQWIQKVTHRKKPKDTFSDCFDSMLHCK